MRRLTLPVLALVLSLAAVTLSAHLSVSKTFPAAGTTISESPQRLQVWFTQSPTVAVSGLALEGPKGKVEVGKVAAGQADGKPDRSLVAPVVGELEPGKYIASWKTSGNDGHILNGTFEFTVATKK